MKFIHKLKYFKKLKLSVFSLLAIVTFLNSCSECFSFNAPQSTKIDKLLFFNDEGLSSSKKFAIKGINNSQTPRNSDPISDQVAITAFQLASNLTDPICKSHEFYRRMGVVEALHPEANAISNFGRKISLGVGAIGCATLAITTSLPASALRAFGSYLQKEPFIYVQGSLDSKTLPVNRSFSLLSWNICCVGAGYSISDGGVVPWAFRIDKIIDKIVEQDADVNCLYETFDTKSAFYICEKLKQKGYNHFYFNIGPKAVGVSSGIMIASKYSIQNPEFTLFPQESLVGRTKNAAKGVFAFDLESHGNTFARIYATHLQHSEQPQFPTMEEVKARRMQMEIILDKAQLETNRCIVVTGDLNLDDEEYKSSNWHNYFQKGDTFEIAKKTWGGDEFCANLVGKPVSGPMNLDHTMVYKGTARSIRTTMVETGFNPADYNEDVLSDHSGLLTKIIT